MVEKKVNQKWVKYHQKVSHLDQPTIKKVHLIVKQTMEITYVQNKLTRQSIDDWQEIFSKQM